MAEFIRQAGVSRQTIYDWMDRGFLKKKTFGHRPYFTQEDLMLVPTIRTALKKNQYRMMKGENANN